MAETHLVVDAMNMIGSRPTGWWRNRDAAVRRLVERLQRLAAVDSQPIIVVVDGRPLPDLPEGEHDGAQILYASRPGRNAADDRIVKFVAAHPEPASIVVITSDRDLSQRVRNLGAEVRGASWLLAKLDDLDA